MLPINFKYKKLTPQELIEKLQNGNGKYSFDSPHSKSTPFTIRFKEENNSNWIARRATEEVQEQYEYIKKKVHNLRINERLQQGRENIIDKKLKYLEFIRERKSQDQQLLQRFKEDYYQRQQQISSSTRNIKEQLDSDLRRAREQVQNQKRLEKEEIMRINRENSEAIKQFNEQQISRKRFLSERVRADKQHSYQTKCKFFNDKQLNQQMKNTEKIKQYENQQNWILQEISALEQEEYQSRQRYNSLQVNRIEKETFMNSFMGIKQPQIKGTQSTKNSQENSPASRYQNSDRKYNFNA